MLQFKFICVLLGLGLVASGSVGSFAWVDASLKPNIMIILVDDWAHSDLQAVRSDDSPWNDLPVIDSLAARGQSWNHFYAQPLCNQTRQSLIFGRYIGTYSGSICAAPTSDTPPASTPSIASRLKSAGYRTAAFGKWHVVPNPNADEPREQVPAAYGFDDWRAFNASNLAGHCGSNGYSDWLRVDDGKGVQTSEYHTTAVANAARAWWEATEGSKFAYVCFQAPHSPFHMPPRELLPEGYPEATEARDQYEAMLVAMDHAIGRLLEVVDLEQTFVLLLGDNGTPPSATRPGDQAPVRAKGSVFEDGVHVPLIVVGPGIAPGQTEALGHVVDLMATVAELGASGDPEPPLTDSRSLAPVFFQPETRVRDHVICDKGSALARIMRGKRSQRKVAVVYQSKAKGPLLKGIWSLTSGNKQTSESFYDLQADPGEETELDGKFEAHVEDMAETLKIYAAYIARDESSTIE